MWWKRMTCLGLILVMMLMVCPGMAEEDPEVPELDELYEAQTVRMRGMTDDSRLYAHYGPGAEYLSAGGYQPYKQGKIMAYFNEGGWVLIDLKYQTAKERYVYMPDSAFGSVDDVSGVIEMQYYEGKTLRETSLRLGPSEDFIAEDGYKSLPEDTDLRVFFRKNGFVYAEFTTGSAPVRMWMPAADVEILGRGTYTPEGRERVPLNSLPDLPVGEWSSWYDYYVAPGDSYEVEQRTVYTRRSLNHVGAPIQGERPAGGNYYSYEAMDENGNTATYWQEYYYSWDGVWSDDIMTVIVSSTDFDDGSILSKNQWRYKRIK